MSNYKLFHGLIRPLFDETLTSWIRRGSASRCGGRFLEGLQYLTDNEITGDDCHVDLHDMLALSLLIGIPSYVLILYFTPVSNWGCLPDNKSSYCAACLMDNFQAQTYLSDRMHWHYTWYNVCPRHFCLLLPRQDDSLGGSLGAIIMSDSYDYYLSLTKLSSSVFSRYSFRRLSLDEALKAMAVDFQSWCSVNFSGNTVRPGRMAMGLSRYELSNFLEDITAVVCRSFSALYDNESVLSSLLELKSWNSLRSRISPDIGGEAFLCRDLSNRPIPVRMATFALIGLVLRLPRCVKIWSIFY
jgi:hypothetical protein